MKHVVFVFIFSIAQVLSSQETKNVKSADSIDHRYKEDQFYFGVTYNALTMMPTDMSQNGFSSGFHLGFIKDMPINKQRNWAIGLGLGYSTNSINQNLKISETGSNKYSFEILQGSEFSKNKFVQHLVEFPLEIRWRGSTAETYKFWRLYTGFKLGYLFASNTKYNGDLGSEKNNNIAVFNKIQYGLTLSVGYDSWNAYIHYLLNPIFKNEAQLNGQVIDSRMAKIGIMFYIL